MSPFFSSPSSVATTLLLLLTCTTHSNAQTPAPASPSPIESPGKLIDTPTTNGVRVKGPHGGRLRTESGLLLETLIHRGGIRVFVSDEKNVPLDLERARGSVSIRISGESKRYRYDLLPIKRGVLSAPTDLTRLSGRQIDLRAHLVGLPAQTSEIRYRDIIGVAPSEEQQLASAVARQRTCPVSGKLLGSMGKPIQASVDGKTVFVCCQGCVRSLVTSPEKDMETAAVTSAEGPEQSPIDREVPKVVQEVRPGVFKAAPTERPFFTAQKTCPVMDEPLESMGGPFRVHANGKAIYICCPGCAKKVEEAPGHYLSLIRKRGVNPPDVAKRIDDDSHAPEKPATR